MDDFSTRKITNYDKIIESDINRSQINQTKKK